MDEDVDAWLTTHWAGACLVSGVLLLAASCPVIGGGLTSGNGFQTMAGTALAIAGAATTSRVILGRRYRLKQQDAVVDRDHGTL